MACLCEGIGVLMWTKDCFRLKPLSGKTHRRFQGEAEMNERKMIIL